MPNSHLLPPVFTTEDGLLVQTKQLSQWKSVLTSSAYSSLSSQVTALNEKMLKIPEDQRDGFDVTRGQGLLEIVSNIASTAVL